MSRWERHQWNRTIDYLTQKYDELFRSDYRGFKDSVSINEHIIIVDIPQKPGVYIIFEEKVAIYVGSSGKGKASLRTRFHDLFYYNKKKYQSGKNLADSFNHTLTYKLATKSGRFNHPDKVRDFYLNMCSFKVVETENVYQARALEGVLILQLEPKYNFQ